MGGRDPGPGRLPGTVRGYHAHKPDERQEAPRAFRRQTLQSRRAVAEGRPRRLKRPGHVGRNPRTQRLGNMVGGRGEHERKAERPDCLFFERRRPGLNRSPAATRPGFRAENQLRRRGDRRNNTRPVRVERKGRRGHGRRRRAGTGQPSHGVWPFNIAGLACQPGNIPGGEVPVRVHVSTGGDNPAAAVPGWSLGGVNRPRIIHRGGRAGLLRDRLVTGPQVDGYRGLRPAGGRKLAY